MVDYNIYGTDWCLNAMDNAVNRQSFLMGNFSRPNGNNHHSSTGIGLCSDQTGWGAILLGFAIFGLLWILDTPYRKLYVPNSEDVPVLADGLLLAPGSHWGDWFTRGYSNFWDVYPEWPVESLPPEVCFADR